MKFSFNAKKIGLIIWFAIILFCLAFYFIYRGTLTPPQIALFLAQFKGYVILIYLLLSLLRGFTLLPSTPLVLTGTILFPNYPFLVLFISMTGIIFSSALIYYFSDFFGFSNYFEKHHQFKIEKIKEKIQDPKGIWVVFLWSFMPFLPTDLICYVAGTVKMDFKRFILAMSAGELIICLIYIFLYTQIASYF